MQYEKIYKKDKVFLRPTFEEHMISMPFGDAMSASSEVQRKTFRIQSKIRKHRGKVIKRRQLEQKQAKQNEKSPYAVT